MQQQPQQPAFVGHEQMQQPLLMHPPPQQQIAPLETEQADDGAAVAAQGAKRRLRKLITLVILVVGLYFLYRYFVAQSESATGGRRRANGGLLGGILGFNQSGDPIMEKNESDDKGAGQADEGRPNWAANESDDSMMELAKSIKAVGLRLQGVSQCRWTQYQREMFGDRESAARRELESVYTECRSRDMCPNVRGYPTWVHAGTQYPGFKSPGALRALVRELKGKIPQPMLEAPAEPMEENIPDRAATMAAPKPFSEDEARALFQSLMREAEENRKADAAAEAVSNRSETGNASLEDAQARTGEALGGFSGGAPSGRRTSKKSSLIRKENVRGVSNFPPLNVPNLPGTHVWALDMEHSDDQTRQGRVPRAAAGSTVSTPELAAQVLAGLEHEQERVASLDPNASSVLHTRYPHSVNISTDDAMADKTIPREKI